MKSLHALVSQFGEPSALVDHQEPNSNCFAIWDWTDTIELSGEKLTVSGKVMEGDALQILQNQLDRWKEQSDGISAIGFISYDAKDIFYPHIPFKKAIGSVPKIWFGKPKKTREYTPGKGSDPKCDHPASLKITGGLITKDKYFRDLSTIRMNLSKGNVYQVNYTFPRQFHVNTDPFSLYLTLRD
ncbi:MAG: hypothetical protein HQ510_05920, partial [Candidatus Marinimicrobia bacterium]|nr:hypothetical protein [Candidatus Neomarinimicrobiota bacterium]